MSKNKNNKDLAFLKEMKQLSESLLDKSDITKLQYLDQMIGDWIRELETAGEPAQ